MMYYRLKNGILKKLVANALKKAGNMRKLVLEIEIPRSSMYEYYNEKRVIKKDNLNKILKYLGEIFEEDLISEALPLNWRQVLGGKKCVESKKQKGVFEKQLQDMRSKVKTNHLKSWHEKMKKENLEKYHLMQYERFKKIGGYKFITQNGERVRNLFEKQVADLLSSLGIDYEYEPLIRSDGKYFFPDFLINGKIIIECTAWRGFDKAVKLKKKIKHLEKNYTVFIVIPKGLKRYYETLNRYLLLGIDDLKQTLEMSG